MDAANRTNCISSKLGRLMGEANQSKYNCSELGRCA